MSTYGPAKWIDLAATAQYPKPNAKKSEHPASYRLGGNSYKTVVRRSPKH
jgi:hypothetical protein